MIYQEEAIDLFSVSKEYYLVQWISADFAMGKGIAIEFDKRFDMKNKLQQKYLNYLDIFIRCRTGGDCILENRVLNLITKERYFNKPSIITMRIALQKMKKICIENGITKIAMPTVDTGLVNLP